MATISEALAMAVEQHQAGRLQAAEQLYRLILQAEPNQADAIHLLGLIAHQAGRDEVAVEYIQRAIGLKGSAPVFHNNLGEAYRALGRIHDATACYRRALELKPNYAEALSNLGNVLKDQGNLDEAVACYRRALEAKPDFADACNNLGAALAEQGKLDQAVALYRRALTLRPDYALARNNLGNALKQQGKLDEAVACYRQALQRKPDYVEARSNLGAALNEQGKLEEAAACCRRALELKPDHAQAHNNLGNALKDQGKLDDAAACYRRALQWKPDYAHAHNNLGTVFWNQGKFEEAVACYRRALELKPDFAEAHNNLGAALKDLGKLEEAVACYRRAVELKPDFAEARCNMGIALEEMGDFRGTEDCFRAALGLNARLAPAHFNLAKLLRGKLPHGDLSAQRRLLEEPELTDAQRILLHFGLAQVLDARGEYAGAAEHLDRGNALQRAEWRRCGQEYDPQEYESLIARMIAACTPDFFERARGFGSESEIPVFVVGLPRSGTTLIEQILASHCQVFGAGEIKLARDSMAALGAEDGDYVGGLRRLDRETAGRLASEHLQKLRALNAAALRIVDKLPENFFYLGLLACLFPRAKVIQCRRDLRDVAVSCWMTYFREIRWANDPRHIASRFHEYQRMMGHWRNVLPVPVLEVDYEETVADLEGVARKLVAWCGLAWDPACLEFHRAKRPVGTASSVQVRQPIYATSVGRWKHYERALAPLFAELETVVAGSRVAR